MKTYYAGGTIGDTYIILCKLYRVAVKEKILVKHYTRHKGLEKTIREIYGLLPNIKVEFLKNQTEKTRLIGAFQFLGQEAEQNKYSLQTEYYPEFDIGEIKRFNLPKTYDVLQISAGRSKGRILSKKDINASLLNSEKARELAVVILGSPGVKISSNNRILDLRGKTTIKEAVSIVRGSFLFYGPAGFLSFVAVSHKIWSVVFLTSDIRQACACRMGAVDEWKKYYLPRNQEI